MKKRMLRFWWIITAIVFAFCVAFDFLAPDKLELEYERGCSDMIEAYHRIKNDDSLVNLFKGWWFGRIDMTYKELERVKGGAEYQLWKSERLPIWSWDKAVFLNLTDDMPERFYILGNPWHGKRISSSMLKSFYDDIDEFDLIPVLIDDTLDPTDYMPAVDTLKWLYNVDHNDLDTLDEVEP